MCQQTNHVEIKQDFEKVKAKDKLLDNFFALGSKDDGRFGWGLMIADRAIAIHANRNKEFNLNKMPYDILFEMLLANYDRLTNGSMLYEEFKNIAYAYREV